jgi:hypothetical protein
MDHLDVLREQIARLRVEIAEIKQLNEEYRLHVENGAESRLAHDRRQDRLEAIQQELSQLAGLGRKVLSVDEMREKHRSRLHLGKRAS